jgi:uncharacterized protein Veg
MSHTKSAYFFAFILFSCFISLASATEQGLVVSTNTLVTDSGGVHIQLTLINRGKSAIYDVQPMIHFHHTMAMMSKIVQLDPGQRITFENEDHPIVLRSGRYPLVIMTNYKSIQKEKSHTQIDMNSFYFREELESAIAGEIYSTGTSNESFLEITLKNNSESFKNIRLMLLLPYGLIADELGQMMGLTIRGGQEKRIKVGVKLKEGALARVYPVHLMIEYGEMLNHYTTEVASKVDFRSFQERTAIIPALGALVVLIVMIAIVYFRKKITLSR